MSLNRFWTVLIAAGLALSALALGAAASQDAQVPDGEDAVEAPPVDLLTSARGAVLVEASHEARDALDLIDGDPESFWTVAAVRKPPPYTFTFELMAPATLSAVGVTGAGLRPGGVVGGSAKTVVVEASGEARGGAFRRLAVIEAAQEGDTLVDVSASQEAAQVRSLRFTIEGAHSPEAAFIYVSEFIAHGAMEPASDPERFTGVFSTGRATYVELKQDGDAVSGCYSDNGGRTLGTIAGTVVEGVALIDWRADDGITGSALFTIDSEGALDGVRYRQRSRSAWGGTPAEAGTTTPCSEETPPANPILAALEKDGEAKIYGILFNHDSDVPRSISLPALTQLLEALETRADLRVMIEGHTDADGADAYNLDLSARRAAAVVAWLTERGIAPERLQSSGKGEAEPVASNKTADGKALNRRVEVRVVE